MIVNNGGILGQEKKSSLFDGSGIWNLNEQSLYASNDLWPSLSYEIISVVASAQLQVTGNNTQELSIRKISGSSSWDAHAYCATPFTAPVTLEFKKNAGASDNSSSYTMISWNIDPTTDANYTSLDYASYPFQTNAYSVYNAGSQVLSTGVWDATKTFYLTYLPDGTLNHYNGSTLLYTVNRGSQTVYFDTSFYSVSEFGQITNVRIIKKIWNGTAYI